MFTILEQRLWIKIEVARGHSTQECFQELREVLGGIQPHYSSRKCQESYNCSCHGHLAPLAMADSGTSTELTRYESMRLRSLRFAGSNQAGVDRFFQSVKILSMTSFGRKVKPWVLCRTFTARKRTSSQNKSLWKKFVGLFTLTVESDDNDLRY